MNLTARITNWLLDNQNMSSSEYEIVEYGVESIMSNLTGTLLVIVVGMFLDCMIEGILVWIFLLPLRKNAGGYHAKTKTGCFLMSASIFTLTFRILLKANWANDIYTFITIISSICIFCLAPVETHNKTLDIQEIHVYRRKARIILIAQLVLYMMALFCGSRPLCQVLTASIFIAGFSVALGKKVYNKKDLSC